MDDKKLGPGGFVIRQTGRKPLFGTKQTTENDQTKIPPLSRSKSSPGQEKATSPAMTPGSRIPRFGSGGFGSRKPISLTEAYKLAGEENRPGPIDGSPSPAPRSWRRLEDRRKSADDAKHEAVNIRHVPEASPNKERIAMRNRVDDGIGKSRTSRWVLEEGLRDDALPSTEIAPSGASPEKSYAWQIDEDFTAGDLQVSDSPRIRVNNPPFTKATRSPSPRKGSTPNPKLEEIRVRELGLTPNVASPRKSKLDEIILREKEAEKQVPLDGGFPRIGTGLTKLDEIKQLETQGLSNRAVANAKLAVIRERNGMTRSVSPDSPRRKWVSRDGGMPRPKSAFEPAGRQVPDTPVIIYKSNAERIADDVRRAAAKKAEEAAETRNRANRLSPQKRDQSRDLLRKLARVTGASPAAERKLDEPRANPSAAVKQRASSLRRSAPDTRRQSNTSSNASKSTSSDRPTVGFTGVPRSRSNDSGRSKRSSVHSEQDPTDRIEAEEMLFAPRDDYSEPGSVRAPSPLVDEDADRTDNDATPKPSKQDVIAMPTPRAPGAFVDTPVTIKAEDRRPSRRLSLEQSPDIKPDLLGDGKQRRDMAGLARHRDVQMVAGLERSRDVETASDPGGAEEKKTARPRSRSLPRRRPPIANSAKPPTVRDDLRNLQRLHNIRDTTLDNLEDILLGKKTTSERLDALLRETAANAVVEAAETNSELDEELDQLAAYEALSASVERDLGVHKDGRIKVEVPLGKTEAQTGKMHLNEVEKSSENNDKLNNKLHEKPIEKDIKVKDIVVEHIKANDIKDIKDKSIKAKDSKAKDNKEKHTHAMEHDCPLCVSQPKPTVTYLHLPLPRLFHLSPRPRLTLLGLLLCALSLWWAAETAMCGLYCRPTTCSSGPAPCVWSFDDPASFGAALPVKLDQWATGGRGRAAWATVKEELADALDGVWGGEMDVKEMTPAQRRRYRRRTAKKTAGLSEEQKAKVDAWRKEREERARGKYTDEGALGGDERMW